MTPPKRSKAYWDRLLFPPTGLDDAADREATLAVYLIKSSPYVKVGIARDPQQRFEFIASNNPHPTHLIGVWWIPRSVARMAEAYCHHELMPFHHYGEWFHVEAPHARNVCAAVCRRAALSRGGFAKTLKFSLCQHADTRRKIMPTGIRTASKMLQNLRGGSRESVNEEDNTSDNQGGVV